jgi:ABC-type multidrug transport system ATPase subunit
VAPTPVIAAEDIEVYYHGGPDAAVRDVSLSLHPGQGLLVGGGPLSGKTSVLRALLGLVPARGNIRLFGEPPGPPPARPVGYGPEGRDFAGHLTLREVVHAVAAVRRLPDTTKAREDALDRAGLSFVAGYRTRRLDEEGFRRLSLAVAVVGDPDLVVLDDPWVLPETLDEIRAARARGAAVLVAARRPAGLAPALGGRLVLIDGRPR